VTKDEWVGGFETKIEGNLQSAAIHLSFLLYL